MLSVFIFLSDEYMLKHCNLQEQKFFKITDFVTVKQFKNEKILIEARTPHISGTALQQNEGVFTDVYFL